MIEFILNKQKIIDSVKKLLFGFDKKVYNYIDFDNEKIFSEPLLFSWLKKPKESKIQLDQILFGYKKKDILTLELQIYSNNEGIVYLPNYGYLHSQIKDRVLNLVYKDGNINLYIEKAIVPYHFEPIHVLNEDLVLYTHTNTQINDYIEISPYELYLPDHPLHHLYSENYRYCIDKVILADVRTDRTTQLHTKDIIKALKIINEFDSQLYSDLLESNRFIFPFENKLVRSFTNPATLGGIYLSTVPSDGLVFYIEEIIHQGSHNFLDIAMLNRSDYFKVDTELMMGHFSGSESDHRTFYDAFHGLYTVAKRVSFFEKIIDNEELFNQLEKEEYIARFYDLKKRWKTGIERVDYKNIFTNDGLSLYNELMQTCKKGFEKFDEKFGELELDMTNQPVNFSYFHYINSNQLNEI